MSQRGDRVREGLAAIAAPSAFRIEYEYEYEYDDAEHVHRPTVEVSVQKGRRAANGGKPVPARVLVIALAQVLFLSLSCGRDVADLGPLARPEVLSVVDLPPPRSVGDRSLEEVLSARRSIRKLRSDLLLDEAQLGQLAWAAQGVTNDQGHRTAPSAEAVYPLELWLLLPSGRFCYDPAGHRLLQYDRDDRRPQLPPAAYDQQMLATAPAVFVICGVEDRMTREYDPPIARRYVQLEAGHAAQNLLLQATALGLGAVPVGGVDSEALREVLDLSAREQPLYAIPVGVPLE